MLKTSCGVFKRYNFFRKPCNKSRMLRDNPQKKGQVMRIRINTPRKPNSARRKTIKLKCTNRLKPVAFVPGVGHSLKRFATILMRGRGPRDTPGVYLSAIRGVWDLFPVVIHKTEFNPGTFRKRRRSIYGGKLGTDRARRIIIRKKPVKKFV